MTGYAKNYRLPMRRASDEDEHDVASAHTLRRSGGGKRMVDINEKMLAVYDEHPTRTGCAFCDWDFYGTAAEGREQARTHRESEHPEVLLIKSKLSKRRAKTPPRKVA